jgi:ribose 5-phosphate isomerase A
MEEHAKLKEAAALRGVEYVRDGMAVGLGTGSTAEFALRGLAERVAGGLRIVGVPTSEKIAGMARDLGIPLVTLEDRPELDLTIDGADEVLLSTFDVIKGRGGALLREKIVALASKQEILIVDESKVVDRLGEHDPVPVEVVSFGWGRVCRELTALGGDPQLRKSQDGKPYVTDSGNYLLDCHFGTIDNPRALAYLIKAITGVVEHGLFIGIATRVIVAHPEGIQVYEKP